MIKKSPFLGVFQTELPELAGSPQASLFQGNGGSADGAKAEDVAEM